MHYIIILLLLNKLGNSSVTFTVNVLTRLKQFPLSKLHRWIDLYDRMQINHPDTICI